MKFIGFVGFFFDRRFKLNCQPATATLYIDIEIVEIKFQFCLLLKFCIAECIYMKRFSNILPIIFRWWFMYGRNDRKNVVRKSKMCIVKCVSIEIIRQWVCDEWWAFMQYFIGDVIEYFDCILAVWHILMCHVLEFELWHFILYN